MIKQEKIRRLAEELMGWAPQENRPWHPYNNLNQTWMLVKKLQNTGFWLKLTTPFLQGEPHFAGFTPLGTTGWNGVPDHMGQGATAQEAICEAALAVLDARDD